MTRGFKMLTFQAAVLATCALLMGTVGTMSKAAIPAPVSVRIANFTFNQANVSVKPGTTVTWTNDDDIPHNVVSKDGSFKSKVLDTGDHFSFTFAKHGQFGYFCGLHPHMTGTIVVKA